MVNEGDKGVELEIRQGTDQRSSEQRIAKLKTAIHLALQNDLLRWR
jgi:hypothetical protein